jgi:hypothetical protein
MSSHTCNICNNKYKTEKTLATHIRKMHSESEKKQENTENIQESKETIQVEHNPDCDCETCSSFKNFTEQITVSKLVDKYMKLVYGLHMIEEKALKNIKLIRAIKKEIMPQ